MLVWLEYLGREVIEWNKICNLSILVLHYIAINDIFSGQKCSYDFFIAKRLPNLELIKIGVENSFNVLAIFLLKRSKALDWGFVWDMIVLLLTSHCKPSLDSCELHLYKLLEIDVSMVVSRWNDRLWNFDPRSIDCLPCLFQVNSSCNLLDQYRCKSFCS